MVSWDQRYHNMEICPFNHWHGVLLFSMIQAILVYWSERRKVLAFFCT